MKASLVERYPIIKDIINLLFFVAMVAIGTILINNFIFRTYSVQGPSMENTLFTNDRLIVNRIPVTLAHLQNKDYIPDRCQVIVFKNPKYDSMQRDENIVKRVVAFAGEKISLKNGYYKVYNSDHPDGFNPDDCAKSEPKSPTSGDISDYTVPEGELFVSGDNRYGSFSYDSRNGLGTVPLYDVIGPVSARIFPFDKLRAF
jgi:signal peptidase I